MTDDQISGPDAIRIALAALGITSPEDATVDGPDAGRKALTVALAALGLTGTADNASRAYLLGALLAVTEAMFNEDDFDRTLIADAHEGYVDALIPMAGGNLDEAGLLWINALISRINRTGIEIWEGVAPGDGKAFLEVAGPAMYAASNILTMTNTPQDSDHVRKAIASADDNLKTARKNLGELRTLLRQHGMQI